MARLRTRLTGKLPSGLQTRVSVLILLPMLLVLAVSAVLAYSRQRERSLASMSLLASQTGRVIEYAIQRDMLLSDFERIQATFDAIGQDPRIHTLYLLDTHGQVVFAPQGQPTGQQLDNSTASCQPCHRLPLEARPAGVVVNTPDGRSVFRSMHPIENRPECHQCHDPSQRLNGLLLTDLSIAPVEASLAANLLDNLAWWAGALVVTAVLANLAVNRWVILRLKRLTQALQEFGTSAFSGRLAETPDDEIGQLSARFNDMADRVEKRDQENVALSAKLTERAKERGQLLERLISAQEEERKRVARELHDDLGQILSSAALTLAAAQREVQSNSGLAGQHLRESHRLIGEASDRMYELIMGLRPSALDDLGLEAALRAQARRTLQPAGIDFSLEATAGTRRLPPEIEIALFRIFQEALTNALRHSRAEHVRLLLAFRDGMVVGEICDDGIGFEPWSRSSAPSVGSGLGLVGMRERAAQLGGEIEVISRPGDGTRIVVCMPVEREP